MGESLKRKFKGKEREVLEVVRLFSVKEAMARYGLKTRRSFMWWLKSQPSCPPIPTNKLAGLKGGEKAKFNREHQETIRDCLEIFGKEFTMENFHIGTVDQLNEVVNRNHRPPTKLTKADRAELKADTALKVAMEIERKVTLLQDRIEIIKEGEVANRKAINQLKEIFGRFTEMVSNRIGEAMVTPFLKHLIPADESFNLPEAPDPLNIKALISQGEALRSP